MSKPATEVALLPLKSTVDVEDSGSASKVWQETMATVSSQDGFLQAYYGTTLEDPSLMQLVIDWKSYEHHKKFMDAPHYQPFVNKLLGIMSGPPKLCHFYPDPFPPQILETAPVVEMATFYGTQDSFLENLKQFVHLIKEEATANGYLGSAYGPVLEDIEKEDGKGKERAVIFCIGWTSKEAHLSFRETATFKKHIHLLRDGISDGEMHLTVYKKY